MAVTCTGFDEAAAQAALPPNPGPIQSNLQVNKHYGVGTKPRQQRRGLTTIRKLANTKGCVPSTKVVYYLENDGTVPIVEWLANLPRKARAKCQAYLARLQSEGHELRRPIADYLRDGIHELRPSLGGVHYRILYFFHGNEAVVVSHGLTKERAIPAAEIERAVNRMEQFRSDSRRYTFIPAEGE